MRTEAPDLVHAHHAWIVGSLIKDVAPGIPVVTHCHATGLRQRALCRDLAEGVRRDLQRNDLFLVLHGNDAKRLETELGVPRSRTRIVGAGYREDVFHKDGRLPEADVGGEIVFVGKFARAKGLPWLLDAVERLADERAVRLHVAGGGSGEEAAEIERRMRDMSDLVVVHGRLTQPELAEVMRRCAVCVLPSFYEGLPLILAEAAACGCRLVATRLQGIVDGLLPALEDVLELVPLPRLSAVDRPLAADLPAFVDDLEEALGRALAAASAPAGRPEIDLDRLTWKATFEKVETAWRELLEDPGSSE